MSLSPRESGEYIVKNAQHLTVDRKGIQNLVKEVRVSFTKQLHIRLSPLECFPCCSKNKFRISQCQVIDGIKSKRIDIENFSQHEHHPSASDSYAPNWIFLIDTLNFCFWTPGDATKWKVDGNTGYFALCAAINRALKEGVDITNPAYYSTITLPDLEHILRSDDGLTKCPLIEERVSILHDVGKKLLTKFDGDFRNCVIEAKNSAQSLIKLVVEEFPCFKDEATFSGKSVAIYKRVQILVGDIWSCYRGEDLGRFDDIQTVTMFADYRVPQVLVHFGAIKYSDGLLELLNKGL